MEKENINCIIFIHSSKCLKSIPPAPIGAPASSSTPNHWTLLTIFTLPSSTKLKEMQRAILGVQPSAKKFGKLSPKMTLLVLISLKTSSKVCSRSSKLTCQHLSKWVQFMSLWGSLIKIKMAVWTSTNKFKSFLSSRKGLKMLLIIAFRFKPISNFKILWKKSGPCKKKYPNGKKV